MIYRRLLGNVALVIFRMNQALVTQKPKQNELIQARRFLFTSRKKKKSSAYHSD